MSSTTAGAWTRRTILDAVEQLTTSTSRPPSPRDVAALLNLPRHTLWHHVAILESEGKLRRLAGGRAIEAIRVVAA